MTPTRTINDLVNDLRELSKELETIPLTDSGIDPEPGIFFPVRRMNEAQPVRLQGYVPKEDVAGLLHYIADMLEE